MHAIGEIPEPLEQLATELHNRNWVAVFFVPDVLRVYNRADPHKNGQVICEHERFRWTSGFDIGPATDIPAAADTITRILT